MARCFSLELLHLTLASCERQMAKERQRARLSDANALFQQQHASAAADAAAVAADGDTPGIAADRDGDRAAAIAETAGAGAAPTGAAAAPGSAGAAPHDEVKAEVRTWGCALDAGAHSY